MAKFKKGQSGNPSGRKKQDPEVKKLLAEKGLDALHTIVDLMHNASEERVRMMCARDIADRAFGKAHQSIEATGEGGGPVQAVLRIVRQQAEETESE